MLGIKDDVFGCSTGDEAPTEVSEDDILFSDMATVKGSPTNVFS